MNIMSELRTLLEKAEGGVCVCVCVCAAFALHLSTLTPFLQSADQQDL